MMKTLAIGLAALVLAGCARQIPAVVTASETESALTLRVARGGVTMQVVDNIALAHCAKSVSGSVPRLVDQRDFDENYVSFRYECQQR